MWSVTLLFIEPFPCHLIPSVEISESIDYNHHKFPMWIYKLQKVQCHSQLRKESGRSTYGIHCWGRNDTLCNESYCR